MCKYTLMSVKVLKYIKCSLKSTTKPTNLLIETAKRERLFQIPTSPILIMSKKLYSFMTSYQLGYVRNIFNNYNYLLYIARVEKNIKINFKVD